MLQHKERTRKKEEMTITDTVTYPDTFFIEKRCREHLNSSGIDNRRINRAVQQTKFLPTTTEQQSAIDPFEGIETKVFVACTSRSGSTYLGQLLGTNPNFPLIRESLKPNRVAWAQNKRGATTVVQAVSEIVKFESSKSIYGVKSEFDQLIRLFQIAEFPKNLSEWKWLFLQRNNKIAQAISIVKATQTRKWVSYGKATGVPVGEKDYDKKKILAALNSIEQKNRIWRTFLNANNIPFLEVEYERIEQDPLSSVQNVYKHIGFVGSNEIDISMVRTEKMRDAISESWEQRFREENSMHQ